MQPVFVDARVRRRVTGTGALTAAAAAAGAAFAPAALARRWQGLDT